MTDKSIINEDDAQKNRANQPSEPLGETVSPPTASQPTASQPTASQPTETGPDRDRLAILAERTTRVRTEIEKVIHGQSAALSDLITAFIAGGHILLEGVPGVAKTLLVRCLASALNLEFSRIQFTPDLMPADITGVNVFEPKTGAFHFKKGPIFADIILADEVNRAPAKTQAAMLEAMQERQVTIDGTTYPLSRQFMVIATQNPLEYEGTYPLPEAQLDRFLMKIMVEYPSAETELAMLQTMNGMGVDAARPHHAIQTVVTKQEIDEMRTWTHEVLADEAILKYIVNIVQQSRQMASLSVGASPRSGVMLLHAAKALALIRGARYVRPEEIHDVTLPVLRHRIALTPESQIEGLTPDACLHSLLKQVNVPR